MRVDRNGMHRMVAGQGQSRYHGLWCCGRLDPARRQLIAHDAIVGLGVEIAIVDRDTGTPRVAFSLGWAKADDFVGAAVAGRVLQSNQKAAGGGGALW
jgi:hypothetical protein